MDIIKANQNKMWAIIFKKSKNGYKSDNTVFDAIK